MFLSVSYVMNTVPMSSPSKIRAAEIAGRANIPTYILSGEDPENLYRIFDGEDIGTVFMT